MRRRGAVTLALPLVLLVAATPGAQAPHVTPGERPSTNWLDQYREPASRLIGEAVGSTFAWQRLAVLTDSIGLRPVSAQPEATQFRKRGRGPGLR